MKIIVLFLMLSVICNDCLAQSIGNVESSNYEFNEEKVRKIYIPASAFNASRIDLRPFLSNPSEIGYKYFEGNCVQTKAVAQVYLPHLSRVTNLRAWVYDNNLNSDVSVRLNSRSNIDVSFGRQILIVDTSDEVINPGIRLLDDALITSENLVNNIFLNYRIEFTILNGATCDEIRLYGVEIEYEIDELQRAIN